MLTEFAGAGIAVSPNALQKPRFWAVAFRCDGRRRLCRRRFVLQCEDAFLNGAVRRIEAPPVRGRATRQCRLQLQGWFSSPARSLARASSVRAASLRSLVRILNAPDPFLQVLVGRVQRPERRLSQ